MVAVGEAVDRQGLLALQVFLARIRRQVGRQGNPACRMIPFAPRLLPASFLYPIHHHHFRFRHRSHRCQFRRYRFGLCRHRIRPRHLPQCLIPAK